MYSIYEYDAVAILMQVVAAGVGGYGGQLSARPRTPAFCACSPKTCAGETREVMAGKVDLHTRVY